MLDAAVTDCRYVSFVLIRALVMTPHYARSCTIIASLRIWPLFMKQMASVIMSA